MSTSGVVIIFYTFTFFLLKLCLEIDSWNGPGLGFVFSSSEATAEGMDLVFSELPLCIQEPLDAFYFYVYGCEVSSVVVSNLSTISGFLYTSDKSLTEIYPPNGSLLLANYWNLIMNYKTTDECIADAQVISTSPGCTFTAKCESRLPISLEVGCGSATCGGCVLDSFFTNFTFSSAYFDTDTSDIQLKSKVSSSDNNWRSV